MFLYSLFLFNLFFFIDTGYTEIFTPDYLTSNEKFHIMRTEGYLSEKTHAIFLEFTIYNFNLGL